MTAELHHFFNSVLKDLMNRPACYKLSALYLVLIALNRYEIQINERVGAVISKNIIKHYTDA
jgi:hypothetical protein